MYLHVAEKTPQLESLKNDNSPKWRVYSLLKIRLLHSPNESDDGRYFLLFWKEQFYSHLHHGLRTCLHE